MRYGVFFVVDTRAHPPLFLLFLMPRNHSFYFRVAFPLFYFVRRAMQSGEALRLDDDDDNDEDDYDDDDDDDDEE